MTDHEQPVVLVAEDEPSVAEGYERWLAERYDVRLADDGRVAVDAVDGSVDVVLLDRMMPELSGSQVLREIRERGADCQVVMVTAVEPDFDVVEMGFDAYITKPPDRQELIDTIERLLDRAAVDESLREYHSLMARKGALEAQKTGAELDTSEEYRDLLDRIEAKQTEVDADLGELDSEMDFVGAVREIEDDDGRDDQ
jgi:DNA-binding response OmpR family regulator